MISDERIMKKVEAARIDSISGWMKL